LEIPAFLRRQANWLKQKRLKHLVIISDLYLL
jgi:hypothetical protein